VDDADRNEILRVYGAYVMTVMMGDPAESIELIRGLADRAPDDDHLELLAASLVETYIHQHEPDGFPLFEAALRQSPNLRQAWSHCWASVPDEWEDRFDAAGADEAP
jgi:hypothetical protein